MLKRLDQDGLLSGDTDAVIACAEASNALADLAKLINAEHDAAVERRTSGVAHSVNAGQGLIKAKELVDKDFGYGHWEDWVRSHLKCSIRTAQLYMQMAGLPDKDAQRVAHLSLRKAVKALAKKKTKRGRWIAQGNGSPLPHDLRVGPFQEKLTDIPDNSVDLIFTDPPYNADGIPLYGDLGEFARRVLRPGGSLLAYAGHYYLPETMNLILPHLQWNWCWGFYNSPSGPRARAFPRGVINAWRPILWFIKPPRRRLGQMVVDMVERGKPEKDFDSWQQHLSEAIYFIDKLSAPGDLVVEPFAGSGTTVLAARALGRHVIAAEIDPKVAEMASARLDSEEEAARAAALVRELHGQPEGDLDAEEANKPST